MGSSAFVLHTTSCFSQAIEDSAAAVAPIKAVGGQRVPQWSVDIIRTRAQRLGTVVTKTEEEAIAVAIKQFDIEPIRRNRITVTKQQPGR
jgi:hypothetical protein